MFQVPYKVKPDFDTVEIGDEEIGISTEVNGVLSRKSGVS